MKTKSKTWKLGGRNKAKAVAKNIRIGKALRDLDLRMKISKFVGMTGWLAFLAALILLTLCRCSNDSIGHEGAQGPVGAQGERGETGERGSDGSNGQDAAPILPIQLCPNVAPTYASVFPEVALCISGHLYGTYNGNTSYQYLAMLPDGAYSSNGQGAACSFTISGCDLSY